MEQIVGRIDDEYVHDTDDDIEAVSYTHLDVYKRQIRKFICMFGIATPFRIASSIS